LQTVTVDHEQLRNHIRISHEKKLPLYIWGTTGIGKSQTAERVAKEFAEKQGMELVKDFPEEGKFGYIDVRISQFDPSDLRGLPDISDEGTSWKPPVWLPRGGEGILFLDEFNLAPPSIQAAAYQLILDRKLGEYKLPDGWSILAAGNRMEDNANVYEIPSPLANRMCHVELRIPPVRHNERSDWSAWAMNNGIDDKIIGFLNFKESLLMASPDDFSKQGVRAFPSPRSWAHASKLIDGVEDVQQMKKLVGSVVGQGAATEFCAFVDMQENQMDIDQILENPKEANKLEENQMKYTLVSGISERYGKNKKVLEPLCKVAMNMEKEFGVLLLRMAKSKRTKHFSKSIQKMDNDVQEWIDGLVDFMG